MASCAACRSTILFGGSRLADLRFCNDTCAANARVAIAAREVPQAEANLLAARIHAGRCPKCSGTGPVDVRTSHEIWSAIFMTRWSAIRQLSCRKCGVKRQLTSTLGSAVLGWWGFPWGLVMTPVQVIRNIVGMVRPHDPRQPSEQLVRHARLLLADARLQQE